MHTSRRSLIRSLTISLKLSLATSLIALSASLAHAQPIEQVFDGITFIKIEGGSFDFGSPPDQPLRRANEAQRAITLNHTFWISKY